MKLRINFRKNCKMYLACSNDELRLVMNYIYFNDGFAYSSNGHILIKNKLSEITEEIRNDQIELLNDKYIHKTSFQKILTYDTINVTETGIECKMNSNYSIVEFKFEKENTIKYPNAEAIFKQAKSKKCSLEKVSISVRFLHIIYQSMNNDDRLVLYFSGNLNDPILVKSQDNSIESEAVIMPIMITEH